MELPDALIKAIESTHVAYQGLSHPLRFSGARSDPGASGGHGSAVISVDTIHDGTTYRAQCRLPVDHLTDVPYVVEALAAAMRHVLTGETEPGAIVEHQ